MIAFGFWDAVMTFSCAQPEDDASKVAEDKSQEKATPASAPKTKPKAASKKRSGVRFDRAGLVCAWVMHRQASPYVQETES